jgi:hypothetical protein
MDLRGFDELKSYLNSTPKDLKEYLLHVVPDDLKNFFHIEDFGWVSLMFSNTEERGLCDIVVDKFNDDLKDLENILEECIKKSSTGCNTLYKAARIQKSINTIKDQRIIEFLSKNNLIPKYGFPVDTVELQSSSIGGDSTLRLNRDLFAAISEYAPESEVVADGNLYTSRYVRRLSGYEWPTYNYAFCSTCNTLTRKNSFQDIKKCRQCGEQFSGRTRRYIIPKFGFLLDNAGPKSVGLNKPERTYKGSVAYIGNEEQISFHKYSINNINIVIGNSKMDSLAVINESNFFICETCGYGKVEDKLTDRFIQYKHENPTGHTCNNDRLNRFSLGHEFQTDVAILKFIDFNISKADEAWTILYSMLEGLSRYLDIERNELSGCLHWFKDNEHPEGNFGFVLFDNTPGGAGYVRQLNNPLVFANMLKYGFKVVSTCVCGESQADTACYSCLLNYYNQKQHDILKRYYAIDFYNKFNLSPDEAWHATRDENVYETVIPFQEEVTPHNLQIVFCNNGQNQSSESSEEIWDNLIEDCSSEEEDVLKTIQKKCPKNISKPWYKESIKISETGVELFTDLVWKEKKVILFLGENEKSYKIAKETDFDCYCLSEEFNIDEFISKIEV